MALGIPQDRRTGSGRCRPVFWVVHAAAVQPLIRSCLDNPYDDSQLTEAERTFGT